MKYLNEGPEFAFDFGNTGTPDYMGSDIFREDLNGESAGPCPAAQSRYASNSMKIL
jgi:hypothetical protein